MGFELAPVEIIIVLAIALLVFGPHKLPELGKTLGKGIRDFKGAISGEMTHTPERSQVAADSETGSSAKAPAAAETSDADADLLDGVVVSGARGPNGASRSEG